MLNPGEFCDDGNIKNNDGCSSECKIETNNGYNCDSNSSPSVCDRCGNGIIALSEDCDDGDPSDNKGCKWEC